MMCAYVNQSLVYHALIFKQEGEGEGEGGERKPFVLLFLALFLCLFVMLFVLLLREKDDRNQLLTSRPSD